MYDYDEYEYGYEATQQYYRRRRLFLGVISFILLLIFLIYVLAPVIQAFTTPTPQPPPETGPMLEQITAWLKI